MFFSAGGVCQGQSFVKPLFEAQHPSTTTYPAFQKMVGPERVERSCAFEGLAPEASGQPLSHGPMTIWKTGKSRRLWSALRESNTPKQVPQTCGQPLSQTQIWSGRPVTIRQHSVGNAICIQLHHARIFNLFPSQLFQTACAT